MKKDFIRAPSVDFDQMRGTLVSSGSDGTIVNSIKSTEQALWSVLNVTAVKDRIIKYLGESCRSNDPWNRFRCMTFKRFVDTELNDVSDNVHTTLTSAGLTEARVVEMAVEKGYQSRTFGASTSKTLTRKYDWGFHFVMVESVPGNEPLALVYSVQVTFAGYQVIDFMAGLYDYLVTDDIQKVIIAYAVMARSGQGDYGENHIQTFNTMKGRVSLMPVTIPRDMEKAEKGEDHGGASTRYEPDFMRGVDIGRYGGVTLKVRSRFNRFTGNFMDIAVVASLENHTGVYMILSDDQSGLIFTIFADDEVAREPDEISKIAKEFTQAFENTAIVAQENNTERAAIVARHNAEYNVRRARESRTRWQKFMDWLLQRDTIDRP